MTASKDSLSKLLQIHELWPARQKNVDMGNYYEGLCQAEIANTIKS